jgi:flagellar biosynthesis protein FliR
LNPEALLDLSTDKLFLYFTTYLLTFARIIGFFVQAPIWGSKHINNQIKVGFMALMTFLIWPHIPLPYELPGGPITLLLLVITQIFIGLVIGYVAFIPMAMAQFGGEIMDIQMGMSSAAQYDPSSKGTINLIRRLKFYLAMLMLMIVNGHHVLIHATAKSFEIIPLTGTRFTGILIDELVRMTGQIFYVGIQITLPVLGALLMVQVSLGIMAKVAPQMNVFMLSFPLNILTGLTMLGASMPLFVKKLPEYFDQNVDLIIDTLRYMIPK